MNSVESVINPPWPLHVRFLNFNCVDPYVPSFNGDKYSFKVPINFSSIQFSSLMESVVPM